MFAIPNDIQEMIYNGGVFPLLRYQKILSYAFAKSYVICMCIYHMLRICEREVLHRTRKKHSRLEEAPREHRGSTSTKSALVVKQSGGTLGSKQRVTYSPKFRIFINYICFKFKIGDYRFRS